MDNGNGFVHTTSSRAGIKFKAGAFLGSATRRGPIPIHSKRTPGTGGTRVLFPPSPEFFSSFKSPASLRGRFSPADSRGFGAGRSPFRLLLGTSGFVPRLRRVRFLPRGGRGGRSFGTGTGWLIRGSDRFQTSMSDQCRMSDLRIVPVTVSCRKHTPCHRAVMSDADLRSHVGSAECPAGSAECHFRTWCTSLDRIIQEN